MAQLNSFYTPSVGAAGHQMILNEFNEGQRTKYLNETIWKHRCESIIPMISDQSWFSKLDNLNCQDELLYKLEPTGIEIKAMNAYNQELKSHTPTQSVQKMRFGEWLYTQMKFSKMELNEKCDEAQFMMDVEEAFRRELDDYIEKLALLRMTCVNACWSPSCNLAQTGTSSAPLLINKDNSHLLPLLADEQKKTICDDRGFFLTWPRCEQMVLSQNSVVREMQAGCCTTDVSAITGATPSFGSKTKIIFSDHVPYLQCANGDRVYKLTHAPFGSFGYASILRESEVVDSSSMEKHWGKIVRMIMRFGMLIPVPWDYTTYYVKFSRAGTEIEIATCA